MKFFYIILIYALTFPYVTFAKGDPSIRRGYDPLHPYKMRTIDWDRFEKKTPSRKFYIEKNYNTYRHPNPDWTYPQNRQYYKGYALKKEQLKYSTDWEFNTNRYGGRTRAGGTTVYDNYKSWKQITDFYKPPTYKKK